MIIDCISDLHGTFPDLAGGDLLIIAGDCTSNDSVPAWHSLFQWLEDQKYRKKVMVAGNHDNSCVHWACSSDTIYEYIEKDPCFVYLCDSGLEFEGLKIWGSPWTAAFEGMNPKCMAFTMGPGEFTDRWLEERWSLIPDDTDILITHSPPYGIFDEVERNHGTTRENVGSCFLREHVFCRIRPRLHVFGHIHAWGGKSVTLGTTKFVNASLMDEEYDFTHKPVRVQI